MSNIVVNNADNITFEESQVEMVYFKESLVWQNIKASTLTLSADSLDIAGEDGSGTVVYSYDGDGEVAASSSDESIATASVLDNTVTITYISPGSVTITVEAPQTKKYYGSSAACSVTCNRSATVESPSGSSKTYDGSALTLSVPSGSSVTSGNNSRTDAGTTTVTFSLDDSNKYAWTDGTTGDKTADISISRAASAYCPDNASCTYDGGGHYLGGYAYCSVSGSTGGVNAGTYYAYYTPDSNHSWSDTGGTEQRTRYYSIGYLYVSAPGLYNTSQAWIGSTCYVGLSYDTSHVGVWGTTSANSAGTWTVGFGLNDTTNYRWSDNGGNEARYPTWSTYTGSITFYIRVGSYATCSKTVTYGTTLNSLGWWNGGTAMSSLGYYYWCGISGSGSSALFRINVYNQKGSIVDLRNITYDIYSAIPNGATYAG